MAKTSKAFVADLPEMSEEQLEKLYCWGQSSCEQFDIHMQGEGAMTLVAVRKKSGTARDHMRLLRTNLQNWGVALPAKQTGWLRLVDEDASAEDKISQALTAVDASIPDGGVALNVPESEAFVRSDFPPAPLDDEAPTPTSEPEQDAGAERGVDRYATSHAEGSAQLIAATTSARTAARLRPPMNLLSAIPVH